MIALGRGRSGEANKHQRYYADKIFVVTARASRIWREGIQVVHIAAILPEQRVTGQACPKRQAG